eukprot:11188023-Ditylum_brightwellii.AAC.1
MTAYGVSSPADPPDPPWTFTAISDAPMSSTMCTDIYVKVDAKLAKITDSLASIATKLKDQQNLLSSDSFHQMIKNTIHFLDQQRED